MLHHDSDEILEDHLGFPIELFSRLGGIPDEQIHLSRAFVTRVVHHILLPIESEQTEGYLTKFLHAVRFVRGDHIVVGFLLLQHEPHHFDVFLGVAPVDCRDKASPAGRA